MKKNTLYDSSAGWWGDGQARTLDQTFFHEQKKGGDGSQDNPI